MGVVNTRDANGNVQEHSFEIGGADEETVAPSWATAKPTTAQAVPSAPKAETVAGATPPNVIKLARQRRAWLKAEIKRLSVYVNELAELERLLAAAKAKPRATVRAIDSNRRVI